MAHALVVMAWILGGGGAAAPLVAQVCLTVSLAFLLLAWAVAPEIPNTQSKRQVNR